MRGRGCKDEYAEKGGGDLVHARVCTRVYAEQPVSGVRIGPLLRVSDAMTVRIGKRFPSIRE